MKGGTGSEHTTVEYFPAAHLEQVALPSSGLYSPGSHAVHVSPSFPSKPGTHLQSVGSVLPAGATAKTGQEVQLVCRIEWSALVSTVSTAGQHGQHSRSA